MQEAGAADAHGLGDLVERGAVVAVRGEAAQGLGQDLVARRDVGETVAATGTRLPGAPPPPTVTLLAMPTIAAARVITPGHTLEAAEVEMDGATIVAVRTAAGAVPDRTLVPGFVDLQVNGIDDVDVATATGTAWERLDRLLLAQGVTTWCPTLVTAPLASYAAALGRIAAAAARPAAGRPHIAGAHLEGPFLGGAPGAHPGRADRAGRPRLAGPPARYRGRHDHRPRGRQGHRRHPPPRRPRHPGGARPLHGQPRTGHCGHRRRGTPRDPPVQRHGPAAPPPAGTGRRRPLRRPPGGVADRRPGARPPRRARAPPFRGQRADATVLVTDAVAWRRTPMPPAPFTSATDGAPTAAPTAPWPAARSPWTGPSGTWSAMPGSRSNQR